MIHITKTRQLITRNSKHVKPTQIPAEQYHWDQLDKHIVTDPLEDNPKEIEKQMPMNHTYTHKDQFKNTQNETPTSDTQQESMTTNPRDNISQ